MSAEEEPASAAEEVSEVLKMDDSLKTCGVFSLLFWGGRGEGGGFGGHCEHERLCRCVSAIAPQPHSTCRVAV
jgi:hypothetical protein